MYSNMVRKYVTIYVRKPGTSRGGVKYQAAKGKHFVYLFFNKIGPNGKRYNTSMGNKVFMTTPNLFYVNPHLRNKNIPTLTARREIVKLAGGNRGIAKVLIKSTINARTTELNQITNVPQRVRNSHEAEKARYIKWNRILGNVPKLQRPIKNNALQNRITAGAPLNRLFRINQPLFNLIKEHLYTERNGNLGQNNPKVLSGLAVVRKQKNFFRTGATSAKAAKAVRSARSAYTALIRTAPGTRAHTVAKNNFNAKVARAYTILNAAS